MNQELREIILAINRTYQRVFNDTVAAQQPSALMSRLAAQFTSTSAEENYAWLTDLFTVRRWTGERESIGGFAATYRLANEIYEGTKALKITDIEDGLIASTATQIATGLANAFQRKKDSVLYTMLDNAFTAPSAANGITTIDNKALFATDHPFWSLETLKAHGTETYKVKADGTFSNRTNARFSEDALWAAYEQFALMQTHYGEPAETTPNLLIVGPKLHRQARQLLTSSTIARETDTPGVYVTETNDTAGLFELLVEPRLGTSTRWFLADTLQEQKPFIVQNRQNPVFEINGVRMSDNMGGGVVPDIVFHKNQVEYGVKGRFGIGYGLPYAIYGSTGDA